MQTTKRYRKSKSFSEKQIYINPKISDVYISKKLGTKCIELHTGKISNKIKKNKKYYKDFENLKKCSILAKDIGLEVHAGHGMDYKISKILSKIKEIEEFNIGHFIIGDSIFYGFKKTIKNLLKIIKY